MKTTEKENDAQNENRFAGVWPALLTPIDKNGDPNFKILESLVELMIEQDLGGLYLLGSTGQGFLLKHEDRKKIVEVATSVNSGRLPLIVQVGAITTAESVLLAQHATKCGADGISSVGPIYYSSTGSSEMTLRHYEQIAGSTDLPFFPYQLGDNVASGNVQDFIDRLLKIPNCKGMKLTTNNLVEISAIANASKGRLDIFSGSDELMCHAALCGTIGAIGSTYNLWGIECAKVRKTFVEGDFQLASSFMLTFQEVIARVLPNFWGFIRQAMQLRYRLDIGMPIPPLGNVNATMPEKLVIELIEQVSNAADFKILQNT